MHIPLTKFGRSFWVWSHSKGIIHRLGDSFLLIRIIPTHLFQLWSQIANLFFETCRMAFLCRFIDGHWSVLEVAKTHSSVVLLFIQFQGLYWVIQSNFVDSGSIFSFSWIFYIHQGVGSCFFVQLRHWKSLILIEMKIFQRIKGTIS